MRPSFLENMSWAMAEVYASTVDRILINLAKYFPYVKTEDRIKGSFEYQARMLAQMGQVDKETVSIIMDSLGGADAALRKALEEAILESLRNEEPALRKAAMQGLLNGRGFLPPEVTPNQMQAFQTYYKQSADKLNLVNTVMLDSTEQAYKSTVSDITARIQRTQTILNTETGEVVTGVTAYNKAVRDGVKRMVAGGLTGFIDHAGHHWSPEAYVAMDVRTTLFNTGREAVWERNEAYGNDLYQVSTKNAARPLCYPWQGKIISNSGRRGTTTDLDGNTIQIHSEDEIESFRYGGGLFGVNCGHYPMVFIPGVSTIKGDPQDPEENAKAYEESQQQRALERKLREEKRDLEVLKAQGATEDELATQRAKVRQASHELETFCDDTGRTRRRSREYTPVNASFDGADAPSRQNKYSGLVEDYEFKKTPGRGSYTIEPNVPRDGSHDDEIRMADFLHRTYGGDVVVRAERHGYKEKNPDYEWRGKLWDLKTPESNKKINERVHKGLKQIEENTGGVIVDISKLTIDEAGAWRQIDDRMNSSIRDTTDIILIRNQTVLGIKRYHKK